MTNVFVTATRTGFFHHASDDNKTTYCGRKVTTKYGTVGTPIETMSMDSNDVFLVPAEVTCEKCLATN